MRLAMGQMQMSNNMEENLQKTLFIMDEAKEKGAEFVFFPEIQLSPFFPKYAGGDAAPWLLHLEGKEIQAICDKCRALSLWASPNVYLEINEKRYDASLVIDSDGMIRGISKMVHICQAELFYEEDYYTPSEDGFRVYDTPFGRIGIVICFDRHIPMSIRSCAKQGAELVLIPTANLTSEPMELFAWETRVQAYQNGVYAAMCNRVGKEDDATFAGESMAAGPDGSLLYQAGREETLCLVDLPMEAVAAERQKRDWLRF